MVIATGLNQENGRQSDYGSRNNGINGAYSSDGAKPSNERAQEKYLLLEPSPPSEKTALVVNSRAPHVQDVHTSQQLITLPNNPAISAPEVQNTLGLNDDSKIIFNKNEKPPFGFKTAADVKILGHPPKIIKGHSLESTSKVEELSSGCLWAERTALIMLVPDIKSVQSRNFLLAAGLMQAHLHQMGVPLCIVLPLSRLSTARSLADDFALNLPNVELYIDKSPNRNLYAAFGLYRKIRRLKKNLNQKWESWGYYFLRGCCGPAQRPCCCVGGYGFLDNTSYMGGIFVLGPGEQQHYQVRDDDGRLHVDCDTILATCTKRAVADNIRREQTAGTLVPI